MGLRQQGSCNLIEMVPGCFVPHWLLGLIQIKICVFGDGVWVAQFPPSVIWMSARRIPDDQVGLLQSDALFKSTTPPVLLSAQGILDDFELPTVRRAVGPGAERVDFVELCRCPTGYIGQFCESCDGKFRRDPPGGGPYAQCIPCECNGHADYCEESSGE